MYIISIMSLDDFYEILRDFLLVMKMPGASEDEEQ